MSPTAAGSGFGLRVLARTARSRARSGAHPLLITVRVSVRTPVPSPAGARTDAHLRPPGKQDVLDYCVLEYVMWRWVPGAGSTSRSASDHL